MSDLFVIVGVILIATLFWQQRKQSELANRLIKQRCEQLGLQLLSTSRGRYCFTSPQGKKGIFALFHFEFSANGQDYYQGQCWMQGQHLLRFDIPPHHLPDF
ncbi:DUF3301 domain-containing protein [Thaumasiovibrio subtropicus]|uniref:DUF3301 domain-containing protein n=1 Tax=Thaumasiovibrio subtropicus TaxID=1891207 RepID=UPI000B34E588|nr:DUF3301 domain-containing protein [Thaumasiovibrio subtropicus]